MLGKIGLNPTLYGGFQGGGAGLAPLPMPVVGRRRAQRDGRTMSRELIKRMKVERQLKMRLKQVMQAQLAGDPTQAKQALAGEYAAAKTQGVEINPKLEAAIQRVLGKKAVEQALKGANGANSLVNGLKNNFGGGGANGGGGGGSNGGGGGGVNGGGGGGNLGATNLNGGGGFGGGGGADHTPKPMSAADHQNLADAMQLKGKDSFNNLFDGWRQTREGNCASVAAIKAGMKEYGADMFKDVQRSDKGYDVTLQDGKKVSLSNEEMAFVRGQAQFAGSDPKALALAELGYGVIAKNHATQNGVSLRAATHDLNNGFDPRQSARLLGLGDKMTQFNGRDGVVWNNSHAVFKGGAYDLWGRPVNGFGGHSAYSFKQGLPGMPSQRFTTTGSDAVQPVQPNATAVPGSNDQASLGDGDKSTQLAAAEPAGPSDNGAGDSQDTQLASLNETSGTEDASLGSEDTQLASLDESGTGGEDASAPEGGDMQLADAGDAGGGGEAPEPPQETQIA